MMSEGDSTQGDTELSTDRRTGSSHYHMPKCACASIQLMKRASRKIGAWLCLTAVLFLQLAVAAYACPTRTDGATVLGPAGAASQPCHTMDHERPKLCEQHCVYAAQTVDTQPHSAVQTPVLGVLSVVVWQDGRAPARTIARNAIAACATAPPPLVRFGVLRI